MVFFLFIQNPIEPMQVDIAPKGYHPPLEDNFTFESATLVGKPLHRSVFENNINLFFSIKASQWVSILQL